MRIAIFIAPKDFKDETVALIKTFFDRWGVQYSITSYSNKECVGYHGAVYRPDVNTAKLITADYDGIILVDGHGMEDYKLFEYRPLLDLLLQFNEKKKIIGAISNSIRVVARANIIRDKKISIPNEEELKRTVLLFHGIPTENPIEISGNIITVKDPSGLESTLQEMLKHLDVM